MYSTPVIRAPELVICTSASVGGYRLSEVTGSLATASVSHAGVWACTTATKQALRTAPRGTAALGYDIITSLAHVSDGVWQTLRVCRPSRTLVAYVSYMLVRKTGSRPRGVARCRISARQCRKNALAGGVGSADFDKPSLDLLTPVRSS